MHVQQTAELAADFFQDADSPEAKTFVQMHADVATFSDAGNQRMVAEPLPLSDGGLFKPPADSLGPRFWADIKRGLGRLVVCPAIGPFGERCPAHNLAIHLGDQDGMARALSLEPLLLLS